LQQIIVGLDQLKASAKGTPRINVNDFPVIQTLSGRLVENRTTLLNDRGGRAFYVVDLKRNQEETLTILGKMARWHAVGIRWLNQDYPDIIKPEPRNLHATLGQKLNLARLYSENGPVARRGFFKVPHQEINMMYFLKHDLPRNRNGVASIA